MYERYEPSDQVFVDREEYLEWMDNALKRCKEKSVVLHLRGIGGIGKSSLLDHWTSTIDYTIHLDCQQYTEFYTRLDILAKGAIRAGVRLQRFDILWHIRKRFVEGVEPAKEKGRDWAKEVLSAIPFIGSLASIGSAIKAVGEKVAPQIRSKYGEVGHWLQDRLGAQYIESLLEILWKDPRRAEFLYLDALLEDINNRKNIDNPIILLFDHFENVDRENQRWRYSGKKISETELWYVFLSSLSNCVGVVGSRGIAPEKKDAFPVLEENELIELNRVSCIEMLELQGVTDEGLQEKIVSVSGGNPFVIDAICDMVEIGELSADAVESLRSETLEEVRLKTWRRLFSHAQDLLALVDRAGLLPFFNRDIMNIITPDLKTDQWNRLLQLSFVRDRGDGNWVLHDLAQELVVSELDDRLHILTDEVSKTLENASTEKSDLTFLGMSLSVQALASPEDAVQRLLTFYLKVQNTPIYNDLVKMLDATVIDSEEGHAYLNFLRGWSYFILHRYADGEHYLLESLDICRKMVNENPDENKRYLGCALLGLSNLYFSTVRPQEAEKGYKEALEIFRSLYKNENLDEFSFSWYTYTLFWFGSLLRSQNRLEEAEHKFKEIISLKDEYLEYMQNYDLEQSWNIIGEAYSFLSGIYFRAGKISKAEETLSQALNGPLQPVSKNITLQHLASMLFLLGRFNEAEEAYIESLKICRKLFETNPNLAWDTLTFSLLEYIWMLRKSGKFSEALDFIKEGRSITQKYAQEKLSDRLVVADLISENAVVLRHNNEISDAEIAYQKSISIFREGVNAAPESWKRYLVGTLNNYAILKRHMNRISEAEETFREALSIAKQESIDNPRQVFHSYRVSVILNNYGVLLRNSERLAEAEEKLQEALEIGRRISGISPEVFNRLIAMILNNLGVTLSESGGLDEAVECFQESLLLRREMAEKESELCPPKVASTLNNLGIFFRRSGKVEDSQGVYREAIEIFEECVSKSPTVYDEDLKRTQFNLNILLDQESKDGIWSEEEEEM